MKILLVDEDRAGCEALRAALGARGDLELTVAHSATEAYEAAAAEERLDVLVTAALMAPQDGFHLSAALRARFPELRVAYMSRTDLKRHYGKVGGDIIFYKPVDTAALLRWLEGGGAGASAGEAAVAPGERGPAENARENGGAGGSRAAREGTRIGDYELLRLLAKGERTETYEALQSSVRRRVAFTLLRDDVRRADPGAVEAFLGEVRAKASVVHQHIAPVYEAHEEDEALFYTRELIEGRTLEQLRNSAARLAPRVTVGLIRAVAESFEYLHARGIAFAPLLPRNIFLGEDDQATLVNIAVHGAGADGTTQTEQIRRFADMVKPVAGLEERTPDHQRVARLLSLMSHEQDREVNASWADLRRAAQEASREIDIGSAGGLPAIAHQARRAGRRRNLVRTALAAGGAICIAAGIKGVLALLSFFDRPEVKDFSEMVRIPAGRFHYQDGSEERELDAFWIDQYEVTIAEYAAFLDALAASPSLVARIDHPDQPESKRGHVPPEWEEYFDAARKGKTFKGQPVDLNCPVTLVDWWDAHAYAAWKGRRLPTEEEWEKAARGRAGNLYPWGDEFVAANLNSSRDYPEDPSDDNAGAYDGYVFWSPVDAFETDASPYDVRGMAGNVSEWTASWTDHPDYPDRQVPVTRGGSFATRTGYELHLRRTANSPEEKSISLGFRTASSHRPEEAVIELD